MSEQQWTRLTSYRTVWAAHLAKLHLAQENIEAEIRHEQLATLTGAIPFSETEVELWVRDVDSEKAAGVLPEHDVTEPQPDMVVACPSCKALSPADFGRCWKCETDLTGSPRVSASVDGQGDDSSPVAAQERLPTAAKFLMTILFAAVIVFGTMSYNATKELDAYRNESPRFTSSWNEDAQCLESRWRDTDQLYAKHYVTHEGSVTRSVYFYRSGVKQAEMIDANTDGVWERVENFTTRGVKTAVSFDDDENGVYERMHNFGPNGKLVQEHLDADEDGRIERVIDHYPDGFRGKWTDDDGDQLFERREIRDASNSLILVEVDGQSEGFRREQQSER